MYDFIYHNRELMEKTLLVIAKYPRMDKLIRNVGEVYASINLSDVHDKDCLNLIKALRFASNNVKAAAIYEPLSIMQFVINDVDAELLERMLIRCEQEDISEETKIKYSEFYSTMVVSKPIIDKRYEIISAMGELEAGGVSSSVTAVEKIKKMLNDLQSDLSDAEDNIHDKEFLLEDDESGLEELLDDREKEDGLLLATGIDALDLRLGGGFKASKTYLLLSRIGGFKSGTMLNFALMIKDNPLNKISDIYKEGLKPVVLYVSRENTMRQTTDRALCYYGYNQRELSKMPRTQYKELVRKHLSANKETGIGISFRTSPKGKMTVKDYYHLDNEYRNKGFKMIMVFDDYIKHLGVNLTEADKAEKKMPGDKKAEEISDLTRALMIPFFTAGQLNRVGMDVLSEKKKLGEDYIKYIGPHHMEGSVNASHSYEMIMGGDRDRRDGKWYWCVDFKKDRDNSAAAVVDDKIAQDLSTHIVLGFKDDGVQFRFDEKVVYNSLEEMFPSSSADMKKIFDMEAKRLADKEEFETKKNSAIKVLKKKGYDDDRISFMSSTELFETAATMAA